MCQCLVENFPMHLVKCACPLCISSFSGCGLYGPQLATVQPQLQPHGPQLENGVLVDAQRGFIQCIVTFMLRHIGILPLPLEADAACFFAANRDIKAPFTAVPYG